MFFSNLCWYLLLIFNAEVYRPSLSPSLSLSLFFCDHNAFRWHRTAYIFTWYLYESLVSTSRSSFYPIMLRPTQRNGAFGVQIVQFHMHTSVRPNKSHSVTPVSALIQVAGSCYRKEEVFFFFNNNHSFLFPALTATTFWSNLADCITIHLQWSSLTVSTPIINVVARYPTAVQSQKKNQILNRCRGSMIFFLKAI